MNSFTPWGVPLYTWKALLKPTKAGGNYTITATCTGCGNGTSVISVTNVTFGDFWYAMFRSSRGRSMQTPTDTLLTLTPQPLLYLHHLPRHCSGQSNMWLPVQHTFSRNDTVRSIQAGKFTNIRIMAGNSGNQPYAKWPTNYGQKDGSNPWMTAEQAIADGTWDKPSFSLFNFGASCWYFGQRLAELGVDVPIGLADTAIGGQRIEEYSLNTTLDVCTDRMSEDIPWFDAQLYGQQILPFVDATIKGWVWYQGENNMGGTKGNSIANVGYGCEQRQLVVGWRQAWSKVPGTTDPLAPFGIVTLASSGTEGGPNMGAMRYAQTANHGVRVFLGFGLESARASDRDGDGDGKTYKHTTGWSAHNFSLLFHPPGPAQLGHAEHFPRASL